MNGCINNRKKLIMLCKGSRILIFALLLVNRSVLTIYLVSFVLSFLLEYSNTVFNALMTDLFSKEELLTKSSIISTASSVSMIAGPLLASLLSSKISLNSMLVLNSILCGIVTLLYALLKIEKTSIELKTEVMQKQGNKKINNMIWNNRKVLRTIVFWTIFMFIIGLLGPIEIVMIKTVLHSPSDFYGIGNSVEGIGMLLASAVLMKVSKKMSPNKVICIGLFLSAGAYFIIGISLNFSIYLTGAILVGCAAALCPLGFKTAIQTVGDKNSLGRVFAYSRFLVILSRLIGISVSGLVILKLGARNLYLLAGVIMSISAVTFLDQRIQKNNIV